MFLISEVKEYRESHNIANDGQTVMLQLASIERPQLVSNTEANGSDFGSCLSVGKGLDYHAR
jgi:hypothetical protein